MGFAFFMGLSVPQYFNESTAVAGYGPVHTGTKMVQRHDKYAILVEALRRWSGGLHPGGTTGGTSSGATRKTGLTGGAQSSAVAKVSSPRSCQLESMFNNTLSRTLCSFPIPI